MNITLPLFIVFEGIDGSGKSALSGKVYDYYISRDIAAIKRREPTEGEWGKQLREILKGGRPAAVEEQLRLFILDREDDVVKNINPELSEKKMILMDRYYFSNAAYQGAQGISPESIIIENIRRGFPVPDRVYLLDIDPDIALARIAERNPGKTDIFEKKALLERIRDIYLGLADNSFLVMDGALTINENLDIITEDIEKNFGF